MELFIYLCSLTCPLRPQPEVEGEEEEAGRGGEARLLKAPVGAEERAPGGEGEDVVVENPGFAGTQRSGVGWRGPPPCDSRKNEHARVAPLQVLVLTNKKAKSLVETSFLRLARPSFSRGTLALNLGAGLAIAPSRYPRELGNL